MYKALPFVRQAFQHHCERFPSVATGLNEIETATLETLERGAKAFGEAVASGLPSIIELAISPEALTPVSSLSETRAKALAALRYNSTTT